MSLKDKTLFITGASRGIGLAVALRAARDGANVAIAAKTETPHPKLPGTIHTAAAEIEAAGGRALALAVDVREEEAVREAITRTAYTTAKFGMRMVVLGLAGELRAQGIAVNALWPRTTIATAAIKNLLGGDAIMRRSRRPEILAEAAYRIFGKPARSFSGQFLIDDTFLAAEGVADFEHYRVDPREPLASDFFVPDHAKPPPGVVVSRRE